MKTWEMYFLFGCVAFSMIPLSRKHAICSSTSLIFNGFVLVWYKNLSGYCNKVNSDPSNSIKDPLISGDDVPFVNIIFQSTCHAWNWRGKWKAHLASKLIMSYFVCSAWAALCALNCDGGFLRGLGPGTKNIVDGFSRMILVVWSYWIHALSLFPTLGRRAVGWPCWSRLFSWLPWAGHLQTKIFILGLGAVRLFI